MDNHGNDPTQQGSKKLSPVLIILIVAVVITAITIPVINIMGKGKQGHNNEPSVEHKKDSVTIKLIFAGDLMGHMPWINSGLHNGNYDYDTTYRYIKPYIESADYAIVNLETTLNGPPYSGYPMFTSPDALARDAKEAGFDFMTLANNHCNDRGNKGITRTNYVLDSLNIPHTGSFIDTAQYENTYPPVVDVRGVKIAILNYTYGTNGLTVYPPNVVNIIDSTSILDGIKKAKAKKPDMIISVVHWGNEYQTKEGEWQNRFAKLMAANGVDLIFGAHPHVVQPIRVLPSAKDSSQKVPVFYSCGNFISNQDEINRDGGIFAEVTITKVEGKTWISDFAYLPFYIRQNQADRSFMAIPLNHWERDGSSFNLSTADSLLAVRFLNGTKKTIGDGVKMSKF
jgi:poly-gamma-glutamate capsule biosynthesis protein CapA/YwtB (metallophosphatase superfamily)